MITEAKNQTYAEYLSFSDNTDHMIDAIANKLQTNYTEQIWRIFEMLLYLYPLAYVLDQAFWHFDVAVHLIITQNSIITTVANIQIRIFTQCDNCTEVAVCQTVYCDLKVID